MYLEFVLKTLSLSEFVSYIFSLCRLRIQMFPPDSDEVVQKASLPYYILYNIASWTVYILTHYTDVETFHNILFFMAFFLLLNRLKCPPKQQLCSRDRVEWFWKIKICTFYVVQKCYTVGPQFQRFMSFSCISTYRRACWLLP